MSVLTLDQIKTAVTEVGSQYGAKRVYLFGSYARGDASPQSDVDLRIDKGKIYGLFELSGFRLAMIKKLGKNVDLLTTESLDRKFRDGISKEEILLYAA